MILGIDTGLATFGWAQLDEVTCEFLDLGVVTQKPIDGESVTLDRVHRTNALARVLATKAPGCTTVCVESLSLGMPGRIAQVSVGLSWGVIVGIVAMMDPRPRLMTIAPQRWQREVVPYAGKQVDYDELAAAAAAHILKRHPRAWTALQKISAGKRQHAIDAAMIALVGALRPHRCDEVGAVS